MTETETKCRSMAMNDQLWTMFDKVHAQTSEFASFFENIGRFHNSSWLKKYRGRIIRLECMYGYTHGSSGETLIDGQQADFDKRVDEIESFKRKIKYYKSQENKSYRLLNEVEELVEVINQWEIISPLLDKINSIGTELEEIISEKLVPKFNKIEMESDKNQVTRTNIWPIRLRLPLTPTHQRPMITYRAMALHSTWPI